VSLRLRILFALLVGTAAGLLSFFCLTQRGVLASDFEWPLCAGRAVLAGQNPYVASAAPIGTAPFDDFFFYPLPAALYAIPFAPLNDYVAGAAFFGLSSGLLCFLSARGTWRHFPVFLSAPFFIASTVAQWGPLIMAASLLPWWGRILAVAKPNLGVIAFVFNPSRRSLVAMIGATILSLAILPVWPIWWIHTVLIGQGGRYAVPVMTFPGIFLALSLLLLESREGRTLAAASFVPRHRYWYDGLLLWLIPRTFTQGLALSVLSWVAYAGWKFTLAPGLSDVNSIAASWRWQITLMYLPLLALNLRPLWRAIRHSHSHQPQMLI
jgi:hypothetical protein